MRVYLWLMAVCLFFHLGCDEGWQPEVEEEKSLDVSGQNIDELDPDWVFQMFEDTPFDLRLISRDFHDIQGIDIELSPELGSIVFDAETQGWQYIPAENVFGEDRFAIVITDPFGDKFTRIIAANILPVNDAPKVTDADLKLPINAAIEFDLPVSDPENQDVSFVMVTPPSAGSFEVLNEEFRVRYTPNPSFSGSDTVELALSDGEATSVSTLNFQVLDGIGEVTATDGMHTTNQGETLAAAIEWEVTIMDDLPTVIDIVDNVQNGLLIMNPNQRDFTYRPNPDFVGQDRFTFRVIFGETISNLATVIIDVGKQNLPPYLEPEGAKEITIECPRKDTCYGKIPATDPEGDKFWYRLMDDPSYGVISSWNRSTGEFTYHPSRHHNYKDDSFTFWLIDCRGNASENYKANIVFKDNWYLFTDSFERDKVMSHEPDFH
ncbi:MAG: tandem-95 repeat protein [Pseudobacteriovorax sp.]|nr:tandem-95 repeat protein [Pseudobacteriovorax sp.]